MYILVPKFYIAYDTNTFKELKQSDDDSSSHIENYINCLTDLNSDLIEAMHPVFSKHNTNENDFKKLSKLFKPLNDDFNGFYKCRLLVKKIDDKNAYYDTKEKYLKVIESESIKRKITASIEFIKRLNFIDLLEAPMVLIDTNSLTNNMTIKISWMTQIGTEWDNIRRIKLFYYVNDEPYGLVLKSMFVPVNYSLNHQILIMSTRDTSECALVCLMNNQCDYFEYKKRLNNNGACMLTSAQLGGSKTKCESECFEMRKGKLFKN